MKIIIIQEKGRNLANQKYREGLSLARGFIELGVDCIVWGLNYDNFVTPFNEISKDADAIILLENYDTGWVPDLSDFKGKKFFWSIDSHIALRKHQLTEKNNKIDITLCAVSGHERQFQNGIYFPNAVDTTLFKPLDIKRRFAVGFCGSYSNREDWINAVEDIRKDIWVLGDRMVECLNQYYIGFNRNVSIDVNYRTFEYAACKTMVLTNYTPNIENLFEIGKEIIVYGDKQDLKEKVRYYKKNLDKVQEIAERGYQRVIKDHTYKVRAKQILDLL